MPSGATQAPFVADRTNIDNRGFLVACLAALTALFLSAVCLVSAFTLLAPRIGWLSDSGATTAQPIVLSGNSFLVRMGVGGRTADEKMYIPQLAPDAEEDRGIVSRQVSIEAKNYPFLRYAIHGRQPPPKQRLYLIWRTAEQPDRLFNTPIYWKKGADATLFLGDNTDWRGHITEIGIDIYGELRGTAIAVGKLTLKPPSNWEMALSIWTEWTAYEPWKQSSAHHLTGTPRGSAILSPTLAMAAWAVLAVALLLIYGLVRSQSVIIASIVAVFIPWLTLDQLWQNGLQNRLAETKYLFYGKPQEERHLAAREPALYSYAKHIKSKLPNPGVKIFLLHDSPIRTYERLKAQYYLLPHNTYNFDRYPRPDQALPGDYLWVLDVVPGLRYSPEQQALFWHGQSIAVKQVDDNEMGALYRVEARRRD